MLAKICIKFSISSSSKYRLFASYKVDLVCNKIFHHKVGAEIRSKSEEKFSWCIPYLIMENLLLLKIIHTKGDEIQKN